MPLILTVLREATSRRSICTATNPVHVKTKYRQEVQPFPLSPLPPQTPSPLTTDVCPPTMQRSSPRTCSWPPFPSFLPWVGPQQTFHFRTPQLRHTSLTQLNAGGSAGPKAPRHISWFAKAQYLPRIYPAELFPGGCSKTCSSLLRFCISSCKCLIHPVKGPVTSAW